MSAAVTLRAPLPLYQEGLAFWEELVGECERHTHAINAVAISHGLEAAHLVQWKPGRGNLAMVRELYPSTEITASISFERWGPAIRVTVNGHQHEDLRFYPEEYEVAIARDLDGRTVAVFGEGRSYSPQELACLLSQRLRRCFPDMALPCNPGERD
jgi:hypothetical protein